MRSEKDYCHTFILDGNFNRLVQQNKKLFPDWYLEAVVDKRREELFNRWRELEFDVSDLKTIIQNPVEALSKEDLIQWGRNVLEVKDKLMDLYVGTGKYVDSKVKD